MVFEAILEARKRITNESIMNAHSKQGIEGNSEYLQVAARLLLGEENMAKNAFFSASTLSMEEGLTILILLASKVLRSHICLPNITKSIYKKILKQLGVEYTQIPYFSKSSMAFDLLGFTDYIRNYAAPRSVIILQAIGSDPTGADILEQDCIPIAKLLAEKKIITFVDASFVGRIRVY